MSEGRTGYLIVGTGAIFTQHAQAIEATQGAVLAGVCSASEARARAVAEPLGVPYSSDLTTALTWPGVDAAVICTPSGLHAQHAVAALRAGKDVLIEKPIALSLADADRILAEAQARNLFVCTVSQRRFEPAIQEIRRVLAAGALGPLSFVEGSTVDYRPQTYYDSAAWRGTSALDGGALMNQGIHMVDLVRWLAGPIVSVAGHTATVAKRMEAEDVATASVVFASGALGTLAATTSAYPGVPHDLRIHGERGLVHLRGQDIVVWQVPGVARPNLDSEGEAAGAAATWGTTFVGHARQYADVTAAFRERTESAITGADGRDSLAVVLAVYESAASGRAVPLAAEGARA